MAAAVHASASSFESETPVPLLQTRIAAGAASKHQYAVAADGRFLINQMAEDPTPTPIILILNWKPKP